MDAKILIFDIENEPIITYSWGIHADPSHSTKFVKKDWKIMCWAAKWLGSKEVMTADACRKKDDSALLNKLWKLLDEADIVIAHNGKKFDCRKANARFIQCGMPPPSPYRVIDTLTEARKHFMFTSNKLGDLGVYLCVGKKMDTGGFDLWIDCMNGDKKAWKKMVKYCKRDVTLLEKVYLKMLPYMSRHPNLSIIKGSICCPNCGGKNLQGRGYYYTQASKKHRFMCKDCCSYGQYLVGKNNVITGVRK